MGSVFSVFLYPCKHFSVLGNPKTLAVQICRNCTALPGGKIHLINRAVHHHIKTVVISRKGKLIHILFQQFRRFGIGYKRKFLQSILAAVVMAYLHTVFPFMMSSVHITVNNKLHISRLIHVQHLDTMRMVHGPPVVIILTLKAEQKSKLIIRHIIRKQPVSYHKGKNIAAVALRQLHAIRHLNPQGNFVAVINIFFLVKKLMHIPLKIQQVHSVACITYPIILCDKVMFLSAFIWNLHLIMYLKRSRLRHHLLDIHHCLRDFFHPQIPPGHLTPTAVDINSAERTVIPLPAGLQIHGKIFFHMLFVKGIRMELFHKVHLLPHMIIFPQKNPCVVPDIPAC